MTKSRSKVGGKKTTKLGSGLQDHGAEGMDEDLTQLVTAHLTLRPERNLRVLVLKRWSIEGGIGHRESGSG